ncbi:hypothetical protein F5B22DRAFT_545879 [Xylaria bambusicola]|uniref:uncharacterized protein n=1 Tax=Xylaria bambusicola TaxID=326684 RepID=UPI00200744B1|nr:uncharacterized protein F5B22DRAFT_545879 [Xylaria bambusicola]KAI0521650.1 hypothetical protein F5B22DRAFT_545879 [Xylaria bambusicola]
MDGIAAIGLTANILQFVDYGARIVKRATEIYRSDDGKPLENGELEDALIDLEWMGQKLKSNEKHASSANMGLIKLTEACLTLSNELKSMLRDLKLKRTRHRVFWSFVQALRIDRKVLDMRELESRIFKLRDQICAHMIITLSEKANSHASSSDILHTNQKIDDLANQMMQILKDRSWKEDGSTAFADLAARWELFLKANQDQAKIRRVIKSLHFPRITERKSIIPVAHQKTFEWVLSPDNLVNFASWLQCPVTANYVNQPYWISGKAGSGKSTLMKYLASHEKTKSMLQAWAHGHRLMIASHFFWSSGTAMQKSQEGLFRTLLASIFLQAPELVPIFCPHRCTDLGHLEPWTLEELASCMEKVVSSEDLPIRLCLFIDGLDEYQGDHSQFISYLMNICRSSYIKICVASRPWIDFLVPFEDSPWKLFMQDLTINDIELYVRDLLDGNLYYQRLKARDEIETEKLIAGVTSKAQGVFLWVDLVLRSLLRGLNNGDGIGILNRRLSLLPSDLERYFELMLNNIEEVYRENTARIFLVMVQAQETLPVLMISFLDEEDLDPHYALVMQNGVLTEDTITILLHEKRHQLIAQCKDLIYVQQHHDEPEFWCYEVGFLHRTVADYFRTKAMDKLLSNQAGSDFDPRRSLCRAGLAQLKTMTRWRGTTDADFDRIEIVYEQVRESAQQYEVTNGVPLAEFHESKKTIERGFPTFRRAGRDLLASHK